MAEEHIYEYLHMWKWGLCVVLNKLAIFIISELNNSYD